MTLKKATLFGYFLALTVSGCNCDENLTRLNAALEVEPTEVDFGKIARGALSERPLLLKNKGSIRLLVERFDVAAPFVGPTDTTSIAIGGETTVTVGFRPTELGPVEGTLSITTNDEDVPVIDVPMLGEGIEAAVRVEPLVVDFGEVLWISNTGTQLRQVTVTNPGTDSFELTSLTLVDGSQHGFGVDVMNAVRTYGPGESESFDVTYIPNARGDFTGAIEIATTAPMGELITVSLMATAVGPQLDICASVTGQNELCTTAGDIPRVDFLAVLRNGMATGAIRLMNSGNRDLNLFGYSVIGDGTEFSFTPDSSGLDMVSIMPGNERVVDVTYTPADYAFDSVTVIFNNDSPPGTVGSARVEGAVARPNIEADPLTITVSLTAPTSMAQVDVDILNCGQEQLMLTSDVVVNQTMGAGSVFSLTNAPTNGTTIQPQDCENNPTPLVTFTLVFNTSDNGFFGGEIPIMSNDPLDPTITVAVSGSRN